MTVQRTDRFPVLSYLSCFAHHAQRWDEARTSENGEGRLFWSLYLARWRTEEDRDHAVRACRRFQAAPCARFAIDHHVSDGRTGV